MTFLRRVIPLLALAGVMFCASFAVAAAAPSSAPSTSSGAVATPTPVPTATPTPSPSDKQVDADFALARWVWVSTLAVAALGFLGFVILRAREGPSVTPVADKDLELTRIMLGFWLVIGGLLMTLAVVIVTINHFRNGQTSDVVAIITSVTGVVGTLTAAFFGIQAAGAGRSQAMSALSDQLRGGSNGDMTPHDMTPAVGPHAGNTRVTITGSGLGQANAVNFGTVPAVNVHVDNDGMLHATSPEIPLDESLPSQKGKSDVQVSVIFPTSTANRVVGTFYYYTLKPEWTATRPDDVPEPVAAAGAVVPPEMQYVESLSIIGSGLSNAVSMEFDGQSVSASAVGDSKVQVPYDDVKALDIWEKDNVEVAVVYAADAPSKRFVVGRFSIPPKSQPAPPA